MRKGKSPGTDAGQFNPRIGISKSLQYILDRDKEQFEVYYGKDFHASTCTFMNALVEGYFEQYLEEEKHRDETLRRILSPYISSGKELDAAIGQLMKNESGNDGKTEKKDGKPIFFRPRGKCVGYNMEIRKMNVSIAGFYQDMLLSYSRKPMYERERIIYRETADKLLDACDSRREISFSYGDHSGARHSVIPYKMVYGTDEQFNYLLCQEIVGKRPMAKSYRLRRIQDSVTFGPRGELDPGVLENLKKMIRYDPGYEINKPEKTVVLLTMNGRKEFNQIYTGRPIPDEEEERQPDADGYIKYVFSCSRMQVFNYFKKFNPGEAVIVSPEKLRRDLAYFHRRHLEELERDLPGNGHGIVSSR